MSNYWISADFSITSRQEKVVTIILRIFMQCIWNMPTVKRTRFGAEFFICSFKPIWLLCIQRYSPLAPSIGNNVQWVERRESAFWSCFNIEYQTHTIPSLVRRQFVTNCRFQTQWTMSVLFPTNDLVRHKQTLRFNKNNKATKTQYPINLV